MAKATKSFVLRLDSATMQAVEKWAANGQLQWIVADALRRNRHLPKHAPTSRQGDNLEESAEAQTQH